MVLAVCPQGEDPAPRTRITTLSKDKKILVEEGMYALVLDYRHYLNAQILGESSVEE